MCASSCPWLLPVFVYPVWPLLAMSTGTAMCRLCARTGGTAANDACPPDTTSQGFFPLFALGGATRYSVGPHVWQDM